MTEVEFNRLSAIIDEGTCAIQKGEILRYGAIEKIGMELVTAIKNRHSEDEVFRFRGQEFTLFSIDAGIRYYPEYGLTIAAYFFNKTLMKEIPKEATVKEKKEIGRMKEIYGKQTEKRYVSKAKKGYLIESARAVQRELSWCKHEYEAFISIEWGFSLDRLWNYRNLFNNNLGTGMNNKGDTYSI